MVPVLSSEMSTRQVQCLVPVLSTKFPKKTLQLMAYQRILTGDGWITYDSCYRRKAALVKSLDWGVINFTLYNETFTGRAKPLPRCRHCSSEHHPSHACSYGPDQSCGCTANTVTTSGGRRCRSVNCTLASMATGVIFHLASFVTCVRSARGRTQLAVAEGTGRHRHSGQNQGH